MTNEELQKKLLRSQTPAWIGAMGVVALTLLINRAFNHPSLIIGPITILMLMGCFMIAQTNLKKTMAEASREEA